MDEHRIKRSFFYAGFVVLVGSLIWMILHPERRPQTQIQPQQTQQSPVTQRIEVPQNAAPQSEQTPEPTSHSEATVLRIAPTRDEVREEAAQNPHMTPKSLIYFAAKMAEKFKVARTSEQNARAFYQELDDCLTSAELRGADSTQALCLRDAQRMALIFPSLHNEFERLRAEATPTVRDLVSQLED